MKKIGNWGFALSLFIHGAVMGALLISQNSLAPKKKEAPFLISLQPKRTTKKLKSTRLDKKNLLKQKNKVKTSAKKSKKKPLKTSISRYGLNKTLESLSPHIVKPGTVQSHISQATGSWDKHEVMGTMNSMNLSEYSENYGFFEHLTSHLNENIQYPKELWEHHIEGDVWLHLRINHKGELLQVIKTSQSARVLRAYVLVCLYKALEFPFPKKYWYSKDKDLILALHFDYSVSSVPNQPEIQNVRAFKNRLEFIRVAKVPNFLQDITRDYARYVPPIAPTPFGPVVNFVQVYRMINAWSEEDPLLQKRNRLVFTKEKMEALLQSSERKYKKNLSSH